MQIVGLLVRYISPGMSQTSQCISPRSVYKIENIFFFQRNVTVYDIQLFIPIALHWINCFYHLIMFRSRESHYVINQQWLSSLGVCSAPCDGCRRMWNCVHILCSRAYSVRLRSNMFCVLSIICEFKCICEIWTVEIQSTLYKIDFPPNSLRQDKTH